jgi:hypothetical protein
MDYLLPDEWAPELAEAGGLEVDGEGLIVGLLSESSILGDLVDNR